MTINLKFNLSFEGGLADSHLLDFYNAADALTGFQRSLALTTHLVLNGEIITQAPSLVGAQILIASPEAGSWKVTAAVSLMLAGGVHAIGTASRDTAMGHLVTSVYDYARRRWGFMSTSRSLLESNMKKYIRKENPLPPRSLSHK
jgi:hypothetical protein